MTGANPDITPKRQNRVFKLDTGDGKKIWCAVTLAGETPSGKAVITSHGLTGNPGEKVHITARDYFTAQGYDVYRFAYYHEGEEFRDIKDCTLELHGKDLNTVIDYVRSRHEDVFVCGHSYGGLTMLFANPDVKSVKAVSFWDASWRPGETIWQNMPEADRPRFGQAMKDEGKALREAACRKLAEAFNVPAKVFLAGKQTNPYRHQLFDSLQGQKEKETIADADHCFVDGDTAAELVKKSHQWFERFSHGR